MKLKNDYILYAYFLCTLIPRVSYSTKGLLLLAVCVMALVVFLAQCGLQLKMPVLMAPFFCLFAADMIRAMMTSTLGLVSAYSAFAAYLPIFLTLIIWRTPAKTCKTMVHFIMILIMFVAASSIVVLMQDPNAARYLATGRENSYANSLYMKNVADYSLIYTMVISLPLLCAAWKVKIISKWIFFPYTILIAGAVIYANYAIAIMLLAAAIVMCCLPKKISVRNLIFVLSVVALLLLIFPDLLAKTLEGLARHIENAKVVRKIEDVISMLRGGETSKDTTGRLELYLLSWENFLKSPIIGNWYKKGIYWGSHSFLLDTLAQYGLIGIGLLLFIYITIYREIVQPEKGTELYIPMLMCMLLGLVVSAVNTGIWINVTVLYASIVLRAREQEKPKEVTG